MNPETRRALNDRWYQLGWFTDATIGHRIQAAAASRPDTALTWIARDSTQRRHTLAEIDRRSTAVALNLQRSGRLPGETLAVLMPNCVEFAIAYCGAMKAGMLFLPIVHYYGRAEVEYILRTSRAKVFIVPTASSRQDWVTSAEQLTDVPDLRSVYAFGEGDTGNLLPWSELEQPVPGARLVQPAVSPDAVCAMVYTSGTTSEPKGVRHTHNSLLANVRGLRETWSGNGPGRTTMQMLPAGHIAGIMSLNTALFHGGDAVFLEAWIPEQAAAVIEEFGVNSTSGSAFFVRGLFDAVKRLGTDSSTLEQVTLGAAGVPASLVIAVEELSWNAVRSYGSSEQLVATTTPNTAPLELRAHTDGLPIGADEISIIDDDGSHLPVGVVGEVVMRGPTQFAGYLGDELNREAFIADGWFRTGDVGFLDSGGYLTITDRKKDIIIRGGENISSQEVEALLVQHPGILEVAVIAAPDERYGERVGAVIVPRPGAAPVTIDELRTMFRTAGLAPQKTPERIWVTATLPRTAAGKVKKFALRNAVRSGELS
jgi:acyl-CoA synthetase (AMP-forming)/AMP-acid ligase II